MNPSQLVKATVLEKNNGRDSPPHHGHECTARRKAISKWHVPPSSVVIALSDTSENRYTEAHPQTRSAQCCASS